MKTTALVDLVEQADRRARVAALLGRLLLAEPDDDVVGVVAAVPGLAALAAASADLACDFERLLLREVPLHESVFVGEDGGRGGDVASAVADVYARHGFTDVERWRVAGVDHLGLELRFFAHLCRQEAAAWGDDRPEEAARVVEAEREFLAGHLGRWGQVAAEAVRDRAGASPYAVLAEAAAEYLADEGERLRPDPDHPGLAPVDVRRPPQRLGPAGIARWLLAPATCGAWLAADDLGRAARSLGVPWRPSDPRSRLRHVVEAALDGGDLAGLLAAIAPAVERWRDRHAALEVAAPGSARRWRAWRLQADETLALIDRLSRAPVGCHGPASVTVPSIAAARDALTRLRPLGLRVAVTIGGTLADGVDDLVDAGADEVLVVGGRLTAVVFADGGDDGDREARHLHDVDVVVRLSSTAEGSTVEPGADAVLTDRVRHALGVNR